MLQLPVLGVLALVAVGLAFFLRFCQRSMVERMNSLRDPELPEHRRSFDLS